MHASTIRPSAILSEPPSKQSIQSFPTTSVSFDLVHQVTKRLPFGEAGDVVQHQIVVACGDTIGQGGDVRRDDVNFCHVACWEFTGETSKPIRNIEPLNYEAVKPAVRSYR